MLLGTNTLLSFLEILGNPDAASDKTIIMELVGKYRNTRNLDNESVVDDLSRQREVNYYVCSVFFHYWFLKNLDEIPDPSFGVMEACSRADVAEAQGYRAMKGIVAFLTSSRFGGLDSVI